MKKTRILLAILTLELGGSEIVQSADIKFSKAVKVLREVGSEGKGNIAASQAMEYLSKSDKEVIPVLLSAMDEANPCLLYTSPSPRDATLSRMPSSA